MYHLLTDKDRFLYEYTRDKLTVIYGSVSLLYNKISTFKTITELYLCDELGVRWTKYWFDDFIQYVFVK